MTVGQSLNSLSCSTLIREMGIIVTVVASQGQSDIVMSGQRGCSVISASQTPRDFENQDLSGLEARGGQEGLRAQIPGP